MNKKYILLKKKIENTLCSRKKYLKNLTISKRKKEIKNYWYLKGMFQVLEVSPSYFNLFIVKVVRLNISRTVSINVFSNFFQWSPNAFTSGAG